MENLHPISSSIAKVSIVLNFQVNFWAIQAGRVFHLSQRIGVVCLATWELLDERWEFLLIATRNVPRVLTIPPNIRQKLPPPNLRRFCHLLSP